jgi:hypothetical protein
MIELQLCLPRKSRERLDVLSVGEVAHALAAKANDHVPTIPFVSSLRQA